MTKLTKPHASIHCDRYLTKAEIARAIEQISERVCDDDRGGAPWVYGGPDHNDDRLVCCHLRGGRLLVTDGNDAVYWPEQPTTAEDIEVFVRGWHEDRKERAYM